MRIFARYAFSIGAAAAFLPGCGGSQPPTSVGAIPHAPQLAARLQTATYKILHSFNGYHGDGGTPSASLIAVGGMLYGTTEYGGSYFCSPDYTPCGTIFSITTDGTETVLHSFGSKTDGAYPTASLIGVKGRLYGTTLEGRRGDGVGTVFSIKTGGSENVLYSFLGRSDGAFPAASLIDVSGVFYGTTKSGGRYTNKCGCGTVFSITPSGMKKVLHSFGHGTDGAVPLAGLIDVGGTFYGTTEFGGRNTVGTVFSITPGGKEKVLHSFGQGTDGALPNASLIAVNGTLYGTTEAGGIYDSCPPHVLCGGTVFSITPGGTEKVLHSFGNQPDGTLPTAPLIELKGKLYGTTQYGGSSLYCSSGCGSVFSITTKGLEKVLYSFGYTTDGGVPVAGLIALNGTLYGTASAGGTYGWGTVFALSL